MLFTEHRAHVLGALFYLLPLGCVFHALLHAWRTRPWRPWTWRAQRSPQPVRRKESVMQRRHTSLWPLEPGHRQFCRLHPVRLQFLQADDDP
ncbi:hypothetical protein ACVOMV_22775 [Mesorhizobium atlanticum]